jgi:type I restriction enzyme S subunit
VADENGVCTTEILPLKFYGTLNPFYMRYTLKTNYFLAYVNSVTKGMRMPRLGTKEGQIALIPLPSLAEQKAIVEKVDKLMNIIDRLEQQIKHRKQLAETLMQTVLREAFE